MGGGGESKRCKLGVSHSRGAKISCNGSTIHNIWLLPTADNLHTFWRIQVQTIRLNLWDFSQPPGKVVFAISNRQTMVNTPPKPLATRALRCHLNICSRLLNCCLSTILLLFVENQRTWTDEATLYKAGESSIKWHLIPHFTQVFFQYVLFKNLNHAYN